MRIAVAVAVALLGAAAAAPAEPRGVELFTGASYAKLEDVQLYGWNGDVVFYLRDKVGLAVDIDGHYGDKLGENITHTSLMGGLHYAFSRTGSVSPFVHGLAGVTRSARSIDVFDVTVSETDTELAGNVGGGLDFRVGRAWAVRALVDYRWIQAEAGTISGPRASIGVVVRLGR
jgi:Outer membrane protein beta-barrel domain